MTGRLLILLYLSMLPLHQTAVLKRAATVASGDTKMKCIFAIEYTPKDVDVGKSKIVCGPKKKKSITVKNFVIKSKEPLCLFILNMKIRKGRGKLTKAKKECIEPTESSLIMTGSVESGKTKIQCVFALEYSLGVADLDKSKVLCTPRTGKFEEQNILTTSREPFCLYQLSIKNTRGKMHLRGASRECTTPPPINTTYTATEGGEEVVQHNSYQPLTGVLVLDVPAHRNFTDSVFLFHQDTDTAVVRKNNTCSLTPLPAAMNVSLAAENFLGRITRTGKPEEVKQFFLNAIQYKLGSSQRADKIPAVQEHCSDVPMIQTEEIQIDETQFEKLNSGDQQVLIIKKEKQSRTCNEYSNACVIMHDSSCARWENPFTGDETIYEFHQISANGICVTCYEETPGGTPCGDTQKECICSELTDWDKIVTCAVQSETNTTVQTNGTPLGRSLSTIVQTMHFEANEDWDYYNYDYSYEDSASALTVRITSPPEAGLEATVVLLNSFMWRAIKMIKLGNVCHFISISNSEPLDTAFGIHTNSNGNNVTIAGEDDLIEHILLDDDNWNWEFEPVGEMADLCLNSTHRFSTLERHISIEQGANLERDDLIFLNDSFGNYNSYQQTPCVLQFAIKRYNSGSWRFDASQSAKLWIHQHIHSVKSMLCCKNPLDNPTCCQENHPDLWETTRVNQGTFDLLSLPANKPALLVVAGEDSASLSSVELLVEDDNGNYVEHIGIKEFPLPSFSVTGALFNNRPHVCEGTTGKCFRLDSDCSWKNDFHWGNSSVEGITSVVFDDWGGYQNAWWLLPDGKSSSVLAGEPPTNIPHNITRPQQANHPCVAKISNHEVFMYYQPKYARIYNIESNTWTELPHTMESRSGGACGFLRNSSGGGNIVLAGGYQSSTSEILQIDNNTWSPAWVPGPDIGVDLYGAMMVPFADNQKLLLVGGYSTKPLPEIRSMDMSMRNWTIVGNLTTPRFYHAALSAPLASLPTTCT